MSLVNCFSLPVICWVNCSLKQQHVSSFSFSPFSPFFLSLAVVVVSQSVTKAPLLTDWANILCYPLKSHNNVQIYTRHLWYIILPALLARSPLEWDHSRLAGPDTLWNNWIKWLVWEEEMHLAKNASTRERGIWFHTEDSSVCRMPSSLLISPCVCLFLQFIPLARFGSFHLPALFVVCLVFSSAR